MQLIGAAWRIGLPIVVVVSSALVLVSAVRSRARSASVSRPVAAFMILFWLRLAGEAAFGDQRPAFERQWKGAAASLLAVAGAIHLWKHYHQRQSIPAATATRSTPRSGPAVLVTMPALGESVTEGTVTRWLKRVGDKVEVGEPLVEVSTDKVDTEIPANATGDLHAIRVPAGSTAPVGAIIAVIVPLPPTA